MLCQSQNKHTQKILQSYAMILIYLGAYYLDETVHDRQALHPGGHAWVWTQYADTFPGIRGTVPTESSTVSGRSSNNIVFIILIQITF